MAPPVEKWDSFQLNPSPLVTRGCLAARVLTPWLQRTGALRTEPRTLGRPWGRGLQSQAKVLASTTHLGAHVGLLL